MNKKNSSQLNHIREKPVFICGHPKSGTSLLRSMLDNHPELIVYPEETYFFRKFLPMSEGSTLKEQLALAEEHLIHIFKWNVSDPPADQAGYPDHQSDEFPWSRKNNPFGAPFRISGAGL